MLRMILVVFTFTAGVTMGLGSTVIAASLFLWNDIFRPSEWARYYGVLSPEYFYPVHIATAVLLLSIFLRRWKRRWNMGATVILITLGWFFVCALFAQYKDLAMTKTIEIAKYFIPLALISASIHTRRAQEIIIYTLAASVGIWLSHYGLAGIMKGEPILRMSIPGGQMTDRNDFMVAGTACVPLMIYTAFQYEGRWQRWIRLGSKFMVGFAAVAVVFSLSRGAMVGFGALFLWYAFLTGKLVKRSAIMTVIAAVAIAAMPSFVWDRMATIEVGAEQTEGSAVKRMEHMLTAVDVTLEYPITGIGADNFSTVSGRYSVYTAEPHSLWLKCAAEYGLPMIVFFILLVGMLLMRLRARAKLAAALGDRKGEAMAVALSCALFGFLATGTFTSQFVSEYLWAIIGLIGAFLATPLETTAEKAAELDPAEQLATSTA